MTITDDTPTHRQKVAVCGSVGTGKSSLLYAILGEISKTLGTVGVFGSIAYVIQTSWIQSRTIQDNISNGKPMERSKYEKSIKACALDKDIEAFNHGDLTKIGQRGLNMSGVHKQRIQLARAVYNDVDIYLLDDPSSALYADTTTTLFNKKTIILITHEVEFLSSIDNILVMKDDKVTQSGNYEELLMAGTAFEELVKAHKDAITADIGQILIDKYQLKTTIMNLPHLLDSLVSDEGENWSAGQRQLFCLGRVLLRRNKILVLDEATASIDSATDTIL
ncbi:unnamed protein product [Lactuca saligna]|uniref:ABC-type xenobiotic transporter n=1 Tax=Lactuca saligna TaxID=75948 RepID=A0AA35YRK0_LACSI|nr:unnamed protein product [Lactuca saligna]